MAKNANLYKPLKSELIQVIDESPLIKTFVLVPEQDFSFATGQFIEVTMAVFSTIERRILRTPLARTSLGTSSRATTS